MLSKKFFWVTAVQILKLVNDLVNILITYSAVSENDNKSHYYRRSRISFSLIIFKTVYDSSMKIHAASVKAAILTTAFPENTYWVQDSHAPDLHDSLFFCVLASVHLSADRLWKNSDKSASKQLASLRCQLSFIWNCWNKNYPSADTLGVRRALLCLSALSFPICIYLYLYLNKKFFWIFEKIK